MPKVKPSFEYQLHIMYECRCAYKKILGIFLRASIFCVENACLGPFGLFLENFFDSFEVFKIRA